MTFFIDKMKKTWYYLAYNTTGSYNVNLVASSETKQYNKK